MLAIGADAATSLSTCFGGPPQGGDRRCRHTQRHRPDRCHRRSDGAPVV